MNKTKPLKLKTPESKVFLYYSLNPIIGIQNMFNLIIIIPYVLYIEGVFRPIVQKHNVLGTVSGHPLY